MKTNTKDRILHRAARVFFAEGFSVGIDRVTSECATAKMTIYSQFKSKDGLICAILDEVRRTLTERITQVIEPALSSATRSRAIFNLVCYGMNDPALRLGLGVRALIEFPAAGHPVHLAALELERAMLEVLQPDPETNAPLQAAQLLLLAQGCFVMAPLLGVRGSRQLASELATPCFDPGSPTGASLASGPPPPASPSPRSLQLHP